MRHQLQTIVVMGAISLCAVEPSNAVFGSEIAQDSPTTTSGADLVRYLSSLVAKDPSMPLADLVCQANEELAHWGLKYEVVVKDQPVEQRCSVSVKGLEELTLRETRFPASPSCADKLVCALYVKRFVGETVELTEPKGVRRVDVPRNLMFAQALVARPRSGTIVSKFNLPGLNSNHLYRVSTDGESVFWRVELMENASEWWRQVRAQESRLRNEPQPYLALRISRRTAVFERNVEFMRVAPDKRPPFEFPARFGGWPYGAFESNGYLVLFFPPCG